MVSGRVLSIPRAQPWTRSSKVFHVINWTLSSSLERPSKSLNWCRSLKCGYSLRPAAKNVVLTEWVAEGRWPKAAPSSIYEGLLGVGFLVLRVSSSVVAALLRHESPRRTTYSSRTNSKVVSTISSPMVTPIVIWALFHLLINFRNAFNICAAGAGSTLCGTQSTIVSV